VCQSLYQFCPEAATKIANLEGAGRGQDNCWIARHRRIVAGSFMNLNESIVIPASSKNQASRQNCLAVGKRSATHANVMHWLTGLLK